MSNNNRRQRCQALSELADGSGPHEVVRVSCLSLASCSPHGYREWKDSDRGSSIWAPCTSSMKHRAAYPCPRGFSACAQGPRHFLSVTAQHSSATQRWFHGKGMILAPPSLPSFLTAATICSSPSNHDMPRHILHHYLLVCPAQRLCISTPKLLCCFVLLLLLLLFLNSLLTATSCFELLLYCLFRPPNLQLL